MAKSVYIYTTDSGDTVKVSLDTAKATLGGFTAPTTADVSPVVPGFTKRMRGVWAEGPSGQNYFFPMGNQDSAIYVASSSVTLTYKGLSFATCSRKGEKIFYGSPIAEGETNITP
jgi:hypothetical protein